MRGTIGTRTYYSCMMPLRVVPKMFTFRDWAEFSPEEREQRVLNQKRIPHITKYILGNEDGYIFASITASYKCPVTFTEAPGYKDLGSVEMNFDEAEFVINDGQHRCAAIAAALKDDPGLAGHPRRLPIFRAPALDGKFLVDEIACPVSGARGMPEVME